jgi:lysophospholipase L1-like esterase
MGPGTPRRITSSAGKETVVNRSKARSSINWLVNEKEDVLPKSKSQSGTPKRRAAWAAFSIAGIALLLAACSATPDPPPAAASTPKAAASPSATATPRAANVPHGSYVALGDSYTAGLGIPEQTGATTGCGQSSSSYPHLVAGTLRLDLTDVSCSSATITDMTGPQSTDDGTNPAQLSALSASTALVTLGIGGNDIGWFSVMTRCTELDLIPALIPGGSSSGLTPCEDYYTSGGTDQIQQRIAALTGPLADTLAQIRQRAPHARVYVVGYPDLLPAGGGGCGDTLGVTAGDIAFLNRLELRLNDALGRAAAAAGDGYVDTYTPSEGHDACAAPTSRWLEPLLPSAPAAPLHPNAVGERGMADAVVQAIRTGS